MYRRKSWLKRNKYAVAGVTAVTVFFLFLMFGGGLFAGLITPPATTAGFSITVKDGMRNIAIDDNYINYTLWGTNDLDDFSDYEQIENGTSLAISAGDLDGYDYYVVNMTAIVPASEYDADDPGITTTDETYDHVFYERWFVLDNDSANELYLYEEPSAAGFVVVNSETFSAITNVSTIDTTVNFTVIAGTNKSQPNALFVSGMNPTSEYDDYPLLLINFNTTVSINDIDVTGADIERYNTTALMLKLDTLGPTPSYINVDWDKDATDLSIDSMSLIFGSPEDAALATA